MVVDCCRNCGAFRKLSRNVQVEINFILHRRYHIGLIILEIFGRLSSTRAGRELAHGIAAAAAGSEFLVAPGNGFNGPILGNLCSFYCSKNHTIFIGKASTLK